MFSRKSIAIGVILSCATLPLLSLPPSTSPAADGQPSITVLFTPGDDCVKAIVEELNTATKSIRVQAYVLTSDSIGAALVAAKERGLDVQVILDAHLARGVGSEAENLLDKKVVVRVDGFHKRAHSKVMIIDSSIVITGSFNFSEKAQTENAENLLIIKGHPEVVRRFNQNWAVHDKHSLPYTATGRSSADKTVTSTKVAEDQETVYVTKYGKRYHHKDCQHVRSGAEAITRDEAIRRGKTPCRRCRPR